MLTNAEHGVSAGEETSAVARLLEIAAHNADELLREARAEAASIVTKAHSDADRLTASSQAEADDLRSSARAEVARLQQLERDLRDRMRGYLTQQLEGLEQIEPTTPG
jgi:cell division septum initiation protein DivIVA